MHFALEAVCHRKWSSLISTALFAVSVTVLQFNVRVYVSVYQPFFSNVYKLLLIISIQKKTRVQLVFIFFIRTFIMMFPQLYC